MIRRNSKKSIIIRNSKMNKRNAGTVRTKVRESLRGAAGPAARPGQPERRGIAC